MFTKRDEQEFYRKGKEFLFLYDRLNYANMYDAFRSDITCMDKNGITALISAKDFFLYSDLEYLDQWLSEIRDDLEQQESILIKPMMDLEPWGDVHVPCYN
jgi:hypothetical protein